MREKVIQLKTQWCALVLGDIDFSNIICHGKFIHDMNSYVSQYTVQTHNSYRILLKSWGSSVMSGAHIVLNKSRELYIMIQLLDIISRHNKCNHDTEYIHYIIEF